MGRDVIRGIVAHRRGRPTAHESPFSILVPTWNFFLAFVLGSLKPVCQPLLPPAQPGWGRTDAPVTTLDEAAFRAGAARIRAMPAGLLGCCAAYGRAFAQASALFDRLSSRSRRAGAPRGAGAVL